MPRPLKTEWYCARHPIAHQALGDDLDLADPLEQLAGQHASATAAGPLRDLDVLEQLAHHVSRGDVLRLRLVGQDHAVAQHVERRSP